jgi:hypothetical protein
MYIWEDDFWDGLLLLIDVAVRFLTIYWQARLCKHTRYPVV